AKIESGEVPHIDKSHHGRVVVLNPDAVQTVHHVPDELRAPLRRSIHATMEASLPLGAERLFRGLVEEEGPLFFLIIELESEFKHFSDFLDYIPKLREHYPNLSVFLAGTLPNLIEKLKQGLAVQGSTLQLNYADARGTVEITDGEELNQIASEPSQPPSFDSPFFSQIRLQLAEGQKPIAFNLDTLRKLQPQFGYGKPEDVDVGHGKIEKVIILDLPVRLIRDFQFRQDRGLDFHGVVRNGMTILSRNFEQEKLEFRWIPLRSLEALLRRMPGHDLERVELESVKAFRINTFTGHISFVIKQAQNQISLEDVQSVTLRKPPSGKDGAKPKAGGKPITVCFDRVIVSAGAATHFERLQEELKLGYYGALFGGEEELRCKLESYTRRLTVGSVGPLAGQTLKLLRRFGLERLIDADGFHYVCDNAQQLPEYYLAEERFEAQFQSLLAMLRELATSLPEDKVRVDDITHKLPTITEWIDQGTVHFNQVKSSHLESAHRELQVLRGFIDHEFQRSFEIDPEDKGFFQQIEHCQSAMLQAKWLADYRSGAYGPALPQGAHADLIFFGTPEDKTDNDENYFLPSVVCSELFKDPDNKSLFERGDYRFSVFFETQLALADHQAREDGGEYATLEAIEGYLDGVAARAEENLEELRASSENIDLSGSPEYQALMKKEEEAYHVRYGQFYQEREEVAKRHQEAEAVFQDILIDIGPLLDLGPEPSADWLEGEEPDPLAFSREFVRSAIAADQQHLTAVTDGAGALAGELRTQAAALKDYVTFLGELLQAHYRWRIAEATAQYEGSMEQAGATLPARVAAAKKLDAKSLEAYRPRIQSQLANADSELQKLQGQVALRHNRAVQAIKIMQATINRLVGQMRGLGAVDRPERLQGELDRTTAVAKRIFELSRSLSANGDKLVEDLTRYGQALNRLRQAAAQVFKLRIETVALSAVTSDEAPSLPRPPPLLPNTDGEGPDREAAENAYREKQQGLEEWSAKLKGFPENPPGLKSGREALEKYVKFHEQQVNLVKLAARKVRLRKSVAAIRERLEIMDLELADLPRRVQESFMPARRELLLSVFIPEAERTLDHSRKAKTFVRELATLNIEEIKQLYLDRAVFRRFSSRQFVRGAHIASNAQSPAAKALRNIQPSVNLFGRTLRHNYNKFHPAQAEKFKLEPFKTMEPALIWDLIQQLHGAGTQARVGYVILPSTLPVDQAVRLMNQKDVLYNGLPMLVLIYASKFNKAVLHDDPRFRDQYFKALKHNVIVNIDGVTVVDNPAVIAGRLMAETLGSTSDTDIVEALPEVDEVVAVKSR
ncbi:MAG: hypothetical protein O7D96_11615, partial [SAR324 cluster bacterium]|nr:hypothetical protein [SAR324 cluster bacterium]